MKHIASIGSEQISYHSDERFQLLSAALPIGIFYTDAYGYCLYTNARWREITGLQMEECIGEGWKSLIESDQGDQIFTKWATTRNSDFAAEFWITTPEKQRRRVRLRTAPMRDRRGTCIGFAGILEDIS